jgi:hypothetical protein
MITFVMPNQKTMISVLIGALSFLLFLIVFSPKNQLLYKTQNTLSESNITLSVRSTTDYGIISKAKEVVFGFASDDILEAPSASVFVGLLYTCASFDEIKISPKMKTVLPLTIDKMTLSHTIFMPNTVMIDSSGNFGKIKGKIDLKGKKIVLELVSSPDFVKSPAFTQSPLFSKFTKNEDGYKYESNF